MKKQFSIIAIFAALLLAVVAAATVGANNGDGKGEVIGVTGIVPGKDLIVHVIALVPPGADRSEVAKEALASQGARPLTKEEFSLTGLVWDQFAEGNAAPDTVEQNYNPNNDPLNGGGLAALQRTHTAWTGVDGSIFELSIGDPNINRCPSLVKECKGAQVFDGENDVAWMNLNGRNTLGVTWSGTTIDEADMALNTKFNWYDNGVNDFDVETVYLHENGHVAGLGHSTENAAVMEAIYDGVRRVLTDDDKAGIISLYPDGANPDPTPTPTPDPTPDPTPTPTPDPSPSGTVSVTSIVHTLSGGGSGDKDLRVRVNVADDAGDPVAGASVDIRLSLDAPATTWTGSASTGSDGSVTFRLRNAPSGCYSTEVTDLTAAGLDWDNVQPLPSGVCKSASGNKSGALQVE